jgi:Ni,Fe-hydrogenase III large subunit
MARSRATKQMMSQSMNPKKWIQSAIDPEKKGALHRALGVPADKKIPEKKLEKAEHSKNRTIRKEADLARTLKRFNR